MITTLIPASGERVLVCGQTGSGKTVALARLAQALSEDERVAVIDTKIEPKYRGLPRARLVKDPKLFYEPESRDERRNGPGIYIWRPSPLLAQDPVELDDVLYQLYSRFRGPLVLDELYPFHAQGGRAGPGMTALLTRGRSRGISTIMGSQRPTWISRFCISESQHYWVYALVDRQDRRRLAEVIPNFPLEIPPPKHHFFYYHHDIDEPILFKPLNLKPFLDEAPEELTMRQHVWL